MRRLIVNLGQPDERQVPLDVGSLTIGRSRENEIFIRNKSLSRFHARLDVSEDGVTLHDLGSKNGTQIDGVAVQERRLFGGESFRCGNLVFTFLTNEPSDDSLPALPPAPGDFFDVTRLPMKQLVTLGAPAADVLQTTAERPQALGKMRILLKVSQLLSSPKPLEDLLGEVLDLAQEILALDRAAILLVDKETGKLDERVVRVRSDLPQGERMYSEHIVRHVVDQGTATLFSAPAVDPRFGQAASIVEQSICASMCAPLIAREKVIGALYVDNVTRPDRFGEEDLEFLSAFANQAALAIDNTFLYRRLEKEAVQRNNLLRFFPPVAIDRLLEESHNGFKIHETEVTILFADISDYTRLSSTLPPRRVVEMLNRYFSVMAEIVFRNQGTLEKYIGDAMMAVWGAPYRQEDDTERAVQTAMEMQRALVDLNRDRGNWPELKIHIGLNSGEVAAGNIGTEHYLQYATIGDATNVASRVCGAAGGGEILLTENVFRALDGSWSLTRLPPVPVKGKEEPLLLYRLEWTG